MTATEGSRTGKTDRRRHARMAVHWAGELSTGADKVECMVHDISPGGAQLQSADPQPLGQTLQLKLQHGGTFLGKIAWCQGSVMGMAFDSEQASP